MKPELIELAHRVRWDTSKDPPTPRLPSGLPQELKDAIAADRETFLSVATDRYQHLPPQDACPMQKLPGAGDYTEDDAKRMASYVANQGDAVRIWIMQRAESYFEQTKPEPNVTACFKAAARDLIAWQHAHRANPVRWVIELGNVETTT